MLKRIISLLLVLTLSAAAVGCSQHVQPAPDAEAAKPTQSSDSGKYLNAAGESLPITLLASSGSAAQGKEFNALYAAANNAFAGTLLQAASDKGSCVVSPLSLEIALQLLANGGDEETQEKLLSAICPGLTKEDVNNSCAKLIEMLASGKGVTVNNAVVAHNAYRINSEFAAVAADYFRSSVGAIDFSDTNKALKQINGWVRDNTDGLIDNLLDDLPPSTAIVLLNALTLELEWDKPFSLLREMMEFQGMNGVGKASVIRSTGEFSYGEFAEGKMALIPYAGGEYAMAVVLPDKAFTPAEAASALMMKISECRTAVVDIRMPKVEIKSKLDILGMADRLGIEKGVRGNYPLMLDDGSVNITKIVQGTYLSVTEFGTVAAASTAIVGTKGAAFAAPEHEIVCDRPYAMFIYHVETGAVLFASAVNNIG